MQDSAEIGIVVIMPALGFEENSSDFGFYAAVGAYMAGLVLKEKYFVFDSHTADSDMTIHKDTRRIIGSIASLPLYETGFISRHSA